MQLNALVRARRIVLGLWVCLALCSFEFFRNSVYSATPYGLDSRPPVGAFLNGRVPPVSGVPTGDWTVEVAFPNLTFEDPVVLLPEPGTNRFFVCGRQGYIWSFLNAPGTSAKTLVLDISSRTQGWEACGLLGMAFHPEWRQAGSQNRGYLYVWYQYSNEPLPGPQQPPAETPGFNRLSRFTIQDGSFIADPNSELVLIQQYDRHVWHNGGGMFFGTDGFLYISTGDEGGLADPFNTTQRLDGGLFSGVLRIDVDRDPSRSHPIRRQPRSGDEGSPPSFTANYYIPNDNPFLDPSGGILEEYFALGVRSPHRMTLDPTTGAIWLGDVGQDNWEEVSLIERGGNYQWPFREGFQPGPKPRPQSLIGTERAPIFEYIHDFGNNSIIGGYVYRGTRFPELIGRYIFGDNGSGRIWAMTYDGVNPPSLTNLTTLPGSSWTGLSSFGIDHANEVYLCKMGSTGRVYRLTKAGVSAFPMPALLSQTGAFTNLNTLGAARGLIPYDVNSALWSDGAEKRRWIAVPNNGAPYGAAEQVSFSATSEWGFPDGTVFVKHFELPVDDTNPNLRKRLETRLLVRDTNGAVYGSTYKWRADNSDADLLTNSVSESITVQTATGTRTQIWYYPSPHDCLTCHTPNAGYVLGPKTRQLNGDHTYAATGRRDNQLRTWNHLGMLNPAIDENNLGSYPQLAALTNSNASLELRARSYLDANCSQCHRPGGVVQAYFDARFETALPSQGIVDGKLANALGITGARVIAPSNVSHSIMHLRMSRSEANLKMPPVARNVVDAQAVALFEQWINSLPPFGILPAPWQHQDIGAVGLRGNASYSAGVFQVSGSGYDIWEGADAFHFAHQPVAGDFEFVARVTGIGDSDAWAKAGLMIRQDLAVDAPNILVFASPENGVGLQYRDSVGNATAYVAGPPMSIPAWLKLTRTGNLFSGHASTNGTDWELVGTRTLSAPESVQLGLAVTAHNDAVLNTASFDTVRVRQGAPPPWENRDIGVVGIPGSVSYSGGIFTINGSGRDIWDPEDGFHFVYQPLPGDGELVARVISVGNTEPWAKAGIMWRRDLSPDSPHAMMFLTPAHGVGFQSRTQTGETMNYSAGPFFTANYWVKLVKNGNTIQGFSSPDGAAWSLVSTQTVSFDASNYAGMAVTSHTNAFLNTGRIDNVRLVPSPNNPPRLVFLKRQTNGWVELRVDAAPNRTCRIDGSTSLTNWTAISTQSTAAGTLLFTNRNASGSNFQFYRAVLPP